MLKQLLTCGQGPVSERRLSENSEYVNPEMRETLGFPLQNGRFVKYRESRVTFSYSETEVTYTQSQLPRLCCEPNLVGSRFSLVNPEFLSVSSPFLKCKLCFNTSFIHSRCKIAFLTEYFCLISSTKI